MMTVGVIGATKREWEHFSADTAEGNSRTMPVLREEEVCSFVSHL